MNTEQDSADSIPVLAHRPFVQQPPKDNQPNGTADWREVLKATLKQRSDLKQTLSTLLFLLDSLAFLRTLSPTSTTTGSTAQEDGGNHEDDNAAGDDDNAETMAHFYVYLHTLYLPSSSTPSTTLLPATSNSSAPFSVQLQSLTPLVTHWEQTGTASSSVEIRKALRRASVEALKWLQARNKATESHSRPTDSAASSSVQSERETENKAPSQQDATSDSRDIKQTPQDDALPTNHIDFSTVPLPNKLLQSTLVRALSEGLTSRASTPSNPTRMNMKKSSELPVDVGVQRWALASLLHHYLGEGFGQLKQADGATSYARDDKDDIAIREFFPDPRRFSVVEAELQLLSPSSPSVSSSSLGHGQDSATTPVLDSFKRDDKLKWLLGEFVPTHTIRRRTPLPADANGSSTSSPPKATGLRSNRMVARSPTAYSQPRRRFMVEQDYLSDVDLQEVVCHHRRRSSSARSAPLTPPHRRAWSADSDLLNLRKEDGNSIGPAASPPTAYPGHRESYDTSSHRDWQGGGSLSRINSYDTYDSQSRLISQKHKLSESVDSRNTTFQKAPLDPVEDHSPQHSPKRPQGATFRDATLAGRPFMNLYIARPSSHSIRSEPAASSFTNRILPPAINELSTEDKQNLVRKNRKLKAMLGETVDNNHQQHQPPSPARVRGVQVQQFQERYTESLRSPAVLQFAAHDAKRGLKRDEGSGSSEMARSASEPPTDITSPDGRMFRSLSVGSYNLSRRDSLRASGMDGSELSPIAASFVSDDGSITSPTAIIPRAEWTEADAAREVRRRKLVKIQAFLGERVPASAISDVVGKIQASPNSKYHRLPMFTKASHKLQRRLTKSKGSKGSLSDREVDLRQKAGKSLKAVEDRSGSLSMDERSRSTSQTSDTNMDMPAVSLSTRIAQRDQHYRSQYQSSSQDSSSADIGKSAEPVILAVRRARKLEQVFGSLPPAQLYSRSARWIPGASNRFASDNVSLASKVSRSSIHRARVASIRFIAESQDPELVEDFARVVLSEESDASDVETGMGSLATFAQLDTTASRHGGASSQHKAVEGPHVLGDDADSEDEHEDEEYLSAPEDKTFAEQATSRRLKDALAQDAYRSSIDTDGSHLSGGKTSSDQQHLRTALLLGSSPSSPPSGTDLLQQRYDRGKSRKNRDSVLSGVTAHSSAGSAYAVDGYGRRHRPQSRASSAGNGTPRSSMESVRIQFKRAHKLATVFGTTRGEVFHRVLDDIEADIAEADDEEMDENEKRDIIESVAALRASL